MSEKTLEDFWEWLEKRKYRFWRKLTDSEGTTQEFVFGLALVKQGFEDGWGDKLLKVEAMDDE